MSLCAIQFVIIIIILTYIYINNKNKNKNDLRDFNAQYAINNDKVLKRKALNYLGSRHIYTYAF